MSEVLNWVAQAVTDFGLPCFNVKVRACRPGCLLLLPLLSSPSCAVKAHAMPPCLAACHGAPAERSAPAAAPLHRVQSPLPLTCPQMLLDFCKEDLTSANAGVRNSAIHLLGVLHRCVCECVCVYV